MNPAGLLGFPALFPQQGHQVPGKEGPVARLSILTYSWYSAAFTHMPRFREQPPFRPSDPGSPLPSFVETAVQFISLNVLFHQTPAPSQRPPPLAGSYGAKTLIAITFQTAASSVSAFLPEAWFPTPTPPGPLDIGKRPLSECNAHICRCC